MPPVQTSNARCAICGTSLLPFRQIPSAVCDSAVCQHQYGSLPDQQKCRHCKRPLAVVQWAAGICDTLNCRSHELQRPLEEAGLRYREEVALGSRRRQQLAAPHAIPRQDVESYPVAILPLNRARDSKLPANRRTRFAKLLRKRLIEARERIARGEPAPPIPVEKVANSLTPAERDAEVTLLNAACTSCRGRCCKKGANHAFHSAATMMRFIERFPTLDDDAIVAEYLSYVGEHTLTNGCIFQGATGCTLRRDMRADICNRFFCGDITVLTRKLHSGQPMRAFLANRSGARILGGQFVDVPVVAREKGESAT